MKLGAGLCDDDVGGVRTQRVDQAMAALGSILQERRRGIVDGTGWRPGTLTPRTSAGSRAWVARICKECTMGIHMSEYVCVCVLQHGVCMCMCVCVAAWCVYVCVCERECIAERDLCGFQMLTQTVLLIIYNNID